MLGHRCWHGACVHVVRRAGALNRGATNEVIEPVDLIDHLFSGLAERPVWQTFLQRLAERLGVRT